MNPKIVLVLCTLAAVAIACFLTDSNLVRSLMCVAGLLLLYVTGCFGFSSDLKGRVMNRLEARFLTEVRDESFHESDPECEFSLYFRAPYAIESVQDELLLFFLSEGYSNSASPIQGGSSLSFLSKNNELELCVLISPCVEPSDEYHLRVGPTT